MYSTHGNGETTIKPWNNELFPLPKMELQYACTMHYTMQNSGRDLVNQNKNLLIICPLKNLYVPSTLHNVFGNNSPIIYFPTSLHISLSVLLITICMQQMMYTCTYTFYSAHHCAAAQFDYSRPIAMAQSPYMNEAINM